VKIQIRTKVEASLQKVKAGFTEDLFLSINPPFPTVRLLQFDGCKAGDKVVLELNFIFFKQQWISNIVSDFADDTTWSFIDIGTKLPFFLRTWNHHHSVEKAASGSIIIDDITFSTGMMVTDILMYPILYGQFLYRMPIYKKRFRN
jgi:ligand-binding SRPBCC domain-containing protein